MSNVTVDVTEMDGDMEVSLCLQLPTAEELHLAIKTGQVNYTTIENSEIWTDEFIKCQKIPLTSNDLCAVNHSAIYVPAYRLTYSNQNYFFSEGSVLVCLQFHHVYQDDGAEELDHVGGHLTKIGISVSNICLALHLLAFILNPGMQNLPGSNLAALAVAVFCSNFFFLISKEAHHTLACITLSLFTLFFFLSSFLWMSVIGFETWNSLRMASTELRLSTKPMERKRYRYYSLYAWLTPLSLVSIVLILDTSGGIEQKFKPGLAKELRCWFTELIPLVIFFLLPLIMVMVSNLIFFLWSAFIIYKHTDRLNQDKKFKSLVRKFSSYGKLAIMTGLTWITGIIAFAVQKKAAWYIFIFFTTFYGLFIFVAFTCTKKVYTHFVKRFPFLRKWAPASHSTDPSTTETVSSERKL